MKTIIKWIYLFLRAMYRFVFIDIGGDGYFKAKFRPSSSRVHIISPMDDDHDPYYDTIVGHDMPGVHALFYLAFAIAFCWIWVPALAWEESVEWRNRNRARFQTWIGDT